MSRLLKPLHFNAKVILKGKGEVKDFKKINKRMILPLLVAKGWREKNGFEKVVITSYIRDSDNSLHSTGLALDLRTRDLTREQKTDYYNYIKNNLTKYYEVYNEKNHIHVEYDDSSV